MLVYIHLLKVITLLSGFETPSTHPHTHVAEPANIRNTAGTMATLTIGQAASLGDTEAIAKCLPRLEGRLLD